MLTLFWIWDRYLLSRRWMNIHFNVSLFTRICSNNWSWFANANRKSTVFSFESFRVEFNASANWCVCCSYDETKRNDKLEHGWMSLLSVMCPWTAQKGFERNWIMNTQIYHCTLIIYLTHQNLQWGCFRLISKLLKRRTEKGDYQSMNEELQSQQRLIALTTKRWSELSCWAVESLVIIEITTTQHI